jgi:hypothetical protein
LCVFSTIPIQLPFRAIREPEQFNGSPCTWLNRTKGPIGV